MARISVADAAEQLAKRPDSVTPEHCRIVQKLIDGAEAIEQVSRAHDLVVMAEEEGKKWVAVLHRAASAPNEVYLKSLRRLRPKRAAINRERGEVIRRGEE